MGQEVIPLIKTTSNPTSGNNTSNGYPLGQHWFNETSGVEYVHKSNGVWSTGGGGLSSVSTDSTITGDGTVGSPLSIATTLGDINTILISI